MTIATPPRERGFMAGLHGRKRDSYPASYSQEQIRTFLEGWFDGNDEARMRRAEARRIASVGYHKEMVAVRSKGNGKITMLTFEQYQRRNERLKRHGVNGGNQ